jgi:hypothetical protein
VSTFAVRAETMEGRRFVRQSGRRRGLATVTVMARVVATTGADCIEVGSLHGAVQRP